MKQLVYGQISQTEGLKKALECAREQKDVDHGVLRLESPALSGSIGISDGQFITGAKLQIRLDKGIPALRKLCAMREGSFSYERSSLDELADLDQGLMIRVDKVLRKPAQATAGGSAVGTAGEITGDDAPSDYEVILAGILAPEDQTSSLINRLKRSTTGDTAQTASGEIDSEQQVAAQEKKAHNIKKLKTTTMRIQALSPVSPTAPPDQPKIESQEVKVKKAINWSLAGTTAAILAAIAFFSFSTFRSMEYQKHIEDGRTYIDRGMYDRALVELQAAIKNKTDDKNAYLLRGRIFLAMNQPARALVDFQKAGEMGSMDPAVMVGRGAAFLQLGKVKEAMKDLDAAMAKVPSDPTAYRVLAAYHLGKGDHKKSIEFSQKLITNAKTQVSAKDFEQLAEAQLALGSYDAAAYNFASELMLDQSNEAAALKRAECYNRLQQYERAANAYNSAILIKPDDALAHFNLALAYQALQKYDLAVKSVSEAIRLKPGTKEYYLNRAKCYAMLKLWGSAVSDFDRVLKMDPDQKEVERERLIAFRKASQTKETVTDHYAQPAQPSVDLKKLAELAKTDEARVAQMGCQLIQAGDAESGIAALGVALKANPDDLSARRYLAHALSGAGQCERAAQEFGVLSRMGALSANDKIGYARALAGAGQTRSAVSLLLGCITKQEDPDDAQIALVEVYIQANMPDQARMVCQRGINGATTQVARDKLNELFNSIGNSDKTTGEHKIEKSHA